MEKFKDTSNVSENVGYAALLREDAALHDFLSREVKNNSAPFRDYAPTQALIDAAIEDVMEVLGINDEK